METYAELFYKELTDILLCQEMRQQFPGLLGGWLTPDLAAPVLAHLVPCKECQVELQLQACCPVDDYELSDEELVRLEADRQEFREMVRRDIAANAT